MAPCSDPRLTYLNQLGYNVLKLPRAGVNPLEVLGRDDKSLDDLGSLSSIWTSKVPAPQPGDPLPATDINGQKTADLKLSVGLDILATVLQGMGVPAPKLSLAYSNATSVQFTLTDVQVVRVPPLDVGHYLSQGDLDTSNPFATYFQDHDKEAYVITEVLKSKTIRVAAKKDSGTSVAVDLPNIQKIVGAHVTVASGGSDGSDLVYQGSQLLTFGFKVFGIAYAQGNWQIHGQPPSGNIAFMTGHQAAPILLSPGKLMQSFPRQTKKAAVDSAA
jgi:hypothetical protein